MQSRRRFLQGTLGLAAATVMPAHAKPFGWPLGIQLYSVGDDLKADFPGTLRRLKAMGYETVEPADFHDHSAAELRALFAANGLACSSIHRPIDDLDSNLNRVLADARTLGVKYIVLPLTRFALSGQNLREDWVWTAQFCNRVGAQVKAAGFQFAYHNHNLEFASFNGMTGLEMLMARTEPDLVKFELDCGWAAAAGLDPAQLLLRNPGRFRLLHVKDIKPGVELNVDMSIETTAIGKGALNWRAIFAAAKGAGVEGYFVELEPPFAQPALEQAAVSAAYLRDLAV